ncbi:MAG: cyclodeaminase/cyclohydrolase family protein [Chloroflexota bacterium]
MSYRGATVWSFIEQVSSARAAPAAGSVTAVAAAMAAALLIKMGRLALRRAGVSLSHDLVIEAEALRRCLMANADADAQAYRAAVAVERRGAAESEIEAAWQEAVTVPLEIAANCQRLLQLAESLQLAGLAAADVQAVTILARACLQVQLLNARANLSRLQEPAFRQLTQDRLALLEKEESEP